MEKNVQDLIDTAIRQYLDFGHSIIMATLFSDFLRRSPPEKREDIKLDILAIWNKRMDDARKNDQDTLAHNSHLSPEVRKKIADSAEEAITRATLLFKGMIQVSGESK